MKGLIKVREETLLKFFHPIFIIIIPILLTIIIIVSVGSSFSCPNKVDREGKEYQYCGNVDIKTKVSNTNLEKRLKRGLNINNDVFISKLSNNLEKLNIKTEIKVKQDSVQFVMNDSLTFQSNQKVNFDLALNNASLSSSIGEQLYSGRGNQRPGTFVFSSYNPIKEKLKKRLYNAKVNIYGNGNTVIVKINHTITVPRETNKETKK